jgi:6-pyruvoyl tetrahydropterin synthase/QueD family protein
MTQATQERFGIRLYKEYFNFGSAHFLIFADGTREELHGHNYRATLELDAQLDDANLVADFLIVKPIFKDVCDSLDHRTLIPLHNPHLTVTTDEREVTIRYRDDRYIIPARDVCLLEIENTASELLAKYICRRFLERLAADLPQMRAERVQVSVEESPGQSAVYELRFTDA